MGVERNCCLRVGLIVRLKLSKLFGDVEDEDGKMLFTSTCAFAKATR